MLLGKVTKRVVASAKLDRIPTRQLLEVEPLAEFGGKAATCVALDSVGAGPGDLVLILQEGSGAKQVIRGPGEDEPLPAQMVIVGVVDDVHQDA